jgi:hypothetical protein
MENQSKEIPNHASPDEYIGRAVRAWWTDGLWDIAMAGLWVLIAIWAYIFVRIVAFPVRTWPWPFITDEAINPMELEIWLWVLGIIPVMMTYVWGAYKLVQAIRVKLATSTVGYVSHPFFLPLSPRVYITYVGLCLTGIVLLAGTYAISTYGPRFASVVFTVVPASLLLAVGQVYRLARYRWMSLIGLVLSVALEVSSTSPAMIDQGPTSFLDVSPLIGNPALPLSVWAVVCLCGGMIGLINYARWRNGQRERKQL